MNVTEIPVILTLPGPDGVRSAGIHVSGIIRCIATESGILKPDWAESLSLVDVRTISDQTAIIRISIGLAWERYYIPQILGPTMGVIDHPGEIELDGIYMSPDGESVSSIVSDTTKHNLVIHEVKSTFKSTKTVGDLSNQWLWLSQCKAYCIGKGTRYAMLHVLFLCGDYTYPIKPLLKLWQIEFTQKELDENWALLVDYRNQRQGA